MTLRSGKETTNPGSPRKFPSRRGALRHVRRPTKMTADFMEPPVSPHTNGDTRTYHNPPPEDERISVVPALVTVFCWLLSAFGMMYMIGSSVARVLAYEPAPPPQPPVSTAHAFNLWLREIARGVGMGA